MNETPFFKTRMGHRFYEHTAPELVRQLARLNDVLEKLARSREETPRDSDSECS